MQNILLQYGVLGVAVIALAWYILRKDQQHSKERKEWTERQDKQIDRMLESSEESNKVLRENTNILSGLKSLLENKK